VLIAGHRRCFGTKKSLAHRTSKQAAATTGTLGPCALINVDAILRHVQPPRGRRTDFAWACAVLTFIPAVSIDWPRRAFELDYPTWLRWIDDTLSVLYLVVAATFLVLRGREVIIYRRQQPGH
jgi:hypothetical protein